MASLPYPRIHITNVRGHGIPPCPLCVFPPRGCVFSHGMHGTHRSLGCVFSHRTHLGGYGILPYPRRPLDNSPTEFTEFTEVSGARYSPTDFTDAHRSFWRRRASHRFHRCTQMVRLRRLLWEDSLVAAWVWQGCHTLLICAHPLSMLKSKCFDHYFQFMLRFYIQG